MNEIVLELFLMIVMAFFMIFGVAGCRKEKREAANKQNRKN